MATFLTRSKINISMLVMQMKKSSWMEKWGGGAKVITTKVGTIERLEVTKDQVEVDKENGNVEKVT